jgi:nicotinamidase/pyrazinamidase
MENLPPFYSPQRIGSIFHPDTSAISAQAAAARLTPAGDDRTRTHLLIVDMQVDFCHTNGSLYVPGAGGDLQRLIEFIFHHAEHITDITCSLDSHIPYQIFHPAWWADAEGNHPPPFTIITDAEVLNGRWHPLLEPEWSTQYTLKLQERARKELTIWPYHCLSGSIGQVLDPELFSAVLWHTLARKSQLTWWPKGNIPKTEHYSIVQPEIPVPEHPQGKKNLDFLRLLKASDYIFIAGEAESHCVLETVEDLVEDCAAQPEVLQRIYILQDCTSPIRHPQIDYEALTHKRFADIARRGIHFVNSTDPLDFLNNERDR